MALNYLARAARRGLAERQPTPQRPRAGSLKPATPSRSPLAEADQRLHLDFFAQAHLALPGGASSGDGPPLESLETGGPVHPLDPAPPAAQTAPRETARETTGWTSFARPKRPAAERPAKRRAGEPFERPSAVQQPRQARTSDRVESPRPPAATPTGRVEARHSTPDPQRLRATSSQRPIEAPGTSLTPVESRAPAADRLLAALASAKRWVTASPADSRFVPQAVSAPRPEPFRAAAVQPALADATNRSPAMETAPWRAPAEPHPPVQPLTRVEIGSIEVEVVAPVKTASQQAPRRASSRASAPSSMGRQATPFGWRQR
jgi:hypothetical protein